MAVLQPDDLDHRQGARDGKRKAGGGGSAAGAQLDELVRRRSRAVARLRAMKQR